MSAFQEGRVVRTIIFSDVHGEPDIISAVLAHSEFNPDLDRLIFAGDAIEVGRDSAGALKLLEEVGAEFLVGNHEYAVFADGPLEYQPLEPAVEATVMNRMARGEWKLAAEVEGVLVTHAGLGDFFADEFECITAAGTVADFVDMLNEEFREALEYRSLVLDGVCDANGPLWFRPRDGASPLSGVTQVAGHTPVALLHAEGEGDRLESAGMYLTDPNVRRWRGQGFPPPVPVRYAVIEDGIVQLVSSE